MVLVLVTKGSLNCDLEKLPSGERQDRIDGPGSLSKRWEAILGEDLGLRAGGRFAAAHADPWQLSGFSRSQIERYLGHWISLQNALSLVRKWQSAMRPVTVTAPPGFFGT